MDYCLDLLREFGVLLRMPYAREIKGHKPLWELRPQPIRLIYFAHTGRRFIILHALRKKTRKLKTKDIGKAERRMEEFSERERGEWR